MDWLMAAVVGASGGVAMEAIDIIKAIKWHRRMPWNVQSDTIDPPQRRADVRPGEEHLPAPGWKAYCVAGVLRLLVSGALTGVVAATYPQNINPLSAFLVGLGALSAVQQVTSLVPLMVMGAGRAALGALPQPVPQSQHEPSPEPADGDRVVPKMVGLPEADPETLPGIAAQRDLTGGGGGS
jgi:hypothetical protein